jgi:hypothetical protein
MFFLRFKTFGDLSMQLGFIWAVKVVPSPPIPDLCATPRFLANGIETLLIRTYGWNRMEERKK